MGRNVIRVRRLAIGLAVPSLAAGILIAGSGSASAELCTVTATLVGGTHVTVTANATGCNGAGPTYAFWLRVSTSPKWILIRGYQTIATYDWDTTGAPVGTIYLGVWAKDGHSSNAQDSIASTFVTVT